MSDPEPLSRSPSSQDAPRGRHKALAVLAMMIAPPLMSVLARLAWWRWGEGREACFKALDLDAPGLVCSTDVEILVSALTLATFHHFLVLPFVFVIRHIGRRRPDGRLIARLEWIAGMVAAMLWVACLAAHLQPHPSFARNLCDAAPFATDAFLALVLLRLFPADRTRTTAPAL